METAQKVSRVVVDLGAFSSYSRKLITMDCDDREEFWMLVELKLRIDDHD